MKPDLERIQEALKQLEMLKDAAHPQPSVVNKRIDSFEIFLESLESQSSQKQQSDTPAQTIEENKELKLPPLNTSDSCADPDPALDGDQGNSLPKIQTDVADQEAKLKQVVQQIRDLYNEGPIVDGWLEYYPPAPESSTEALREIVFECLSDNTAADNSPTSGEENCQSSLACYRVCGIDASGQQWCYPCPLEQLLSVSVAIARYQKLQQLLQQKQQLETVRSQDL